MPLRVPTSILRPSFQRTLLNPAFSRPLSTTPRSLLKEGDHFDPEAVDAKKREQIEKQKRGEGHWHEELGSRSEAHVKADREDVDDHDKHMKELQHEGKKEAEKGGGMAGEGGNKA